MKKKALKSNAERKAWVGVASPDRQRYGTFSHPGFLSESWHDTKDSFMTKTKTFERTGRFRQRKASVIGLDSGTPQLSSASPFHLVKAKQSPHAHGENFTEAMDNGDRIMLAGLPNILYELQDNTDTPGFHTSIEKKPAFISAKERIKAAIDRLKNEQGGAYKR